MTRIFHRLWMKMDSMSGCGIRLVFTLSPIESILQYTSEITFTTLVPWILQAMNLKFKISKVYTIWLQR